MISESTTRNHDSKKKTVYTFSEMVRKGWIITNGYINNGFIDYKHYRFDAIDIPV